MTSSAICAAMAAPYIFLASDIGTRPGRKPLRFIFLRCSLSASWRRGSSSSCVARMSSSKSTGERSLIVTSMGLSMGEARSGSPIKSDAAPAAGPRLSKRAVKLAGSAAGHREGTRHSGRSGRQREEPVDLGEVVVGEAPARRGGVGADLVRLRSPGDDGEDGRMREEPREGEVGERVAARLGEGAQPLDGVEVFVGEERVAAALVAAEPAALGG